MFNKKKDLKVEFWTKVPGLSHIPEILPKQENRSLPSWWKKTRYYEKSVKQCPSFPQLFSSSYVIPMWCDTELSREGDMFFWKTSSDKFSWSYHKGEQFLDHAPSNVKDKYFIVAKALCPWRIKTPPGYSVLQTSAFWHFNDKFSIAQGVVDTDFHHEINQQVFLSLEDGESVVIERGTPFVSYFPFKRDFFSIEVREESEKDFLDDQGSALIYTTKFINGYRDHQRYINKNEKS